MYPGEVTIRTGSRDITDNDLFFNKKIMELFKDEGWRKRWIDPGEIYAGPFCCTLLEIDIPF